MATSDEDLAIGSRSQSNQGVRTKGNKRQCFWKISKAFDGSFKNFHFWNDNFPRSLACFSSIQNIRMRRKR